MRSNNNGIELYYSAERLSRMFGGGGGEFCDDRYLKRDKPIFLKITEGSPYYLLLQKYLK